MNTTQQTARVVRANGEKAYNDGYPRETNPVSYCDENCQFSTTQAQLRDEWFAGWDAGLDKFAPFR
jgi:ribosome modulation factor